MRFYAETECYSYLFRGTWHGGWNERNLADWMSSSTPWRDFIEPSFSGNGAFLYEDENSREIYFRLLALKERILTG